MGNQAAAANTAKPTTSAPASKEHRRRLGPSSWSMSSSAAASSLSSPPRGHRRTLSAFVVAVLGGLCFQLGVMVGIDAGLRRQCGAGIVDASEGGTEAAADGRRSLATAALAASAAGNVTHLHPAATAASARKVLLEDDGRQRSHLRPGGRAREGCACECECDGVDPAVGVPTNRAVERPPPPGPPQDRPPGSKRPDRPEARPLSSREDELRIVRAKGSNLAVGAAYVKRNDFFATAVADWGVPVDRSDGSRDDVLILYTSEASLPTRSNGRSSSNNNNNNNNSNASSSPAAKAVENCLTMKVVLTELDVNSNCIAIVGYPEESYHVHRFHRVRPVPSGDSNQQASGRVEVHPDAPLRPVPRSVETRGGVQDPYLPSRNEMDRHMDELVRYVGGFRATLDALRPVARAAAKSSLDGNTVVAMAVNHGQSELLANFVCSARARNLDLSQVLVFATDPAAAALATSLGVRVFDARDAFGAIPAEAAGNYGDESFGKIVVAKVYCVHLLVWLGHDILLQDVDMVWMRHPLEYLTPSRTEGLDMIFQDDGSRHLLYSPYYANTGFYFVKSNDRTAFFFSSLVRMGDVLGKLQCDQQTMTVFLNEHASWRGLKIKVLPREAENGTLFPNGYHYVVDKAYMRKLLQGEVNPYIFHMNWTPNKAMKLKFLSQLGEWRVKPACLNATSPVGRPPTVGGAAALACCFAEAIVECHFRDLPSRGGCRDSPPYLGENPPFWP